jgi:hypothetical protein
MDQTYTAVILIPNRITQTEGINDSAVVLQLLGLDVTHAKITVFPTLIFVLKIGFILTNVERLGAEMNSYNMFVRKSEVKDKVVRTILK